MKKYSLQDISTYLERNSEVVTQWFKELEVKLNHHALIENGEKVYDKNDLKIAEYISEKRDEKRTFEEIFSSIEEKFPLRPQKDQTQTETKTNEENKQPFTGMGRDPETLFYEIAQDNEVIQMFKYHSLRVMFLASSLAKRANCYDEDLRVAALLHDIGKMGLSKNILLKPGKLTELEFTIIQSHSHIGNTIVRKHLGLTRAAKFIRDHHERWDGSGYPRRLVGDEITVQGRIIGICDAFDTMTIDRRNYKKAVLSYSDAFQELRNGSWSQFDGNLVNIFIDMMEEIAIPDYMLQEF